MQRWKKRGHRKIGEFRKKINDSKILIFTEHRIKSKIEKIFVNEKIIKKYCVKIYEIWSLFLWLLWIKEVDENGHSYILFRVDVYFSEYILAVEVNEKENTDRDLIF